MKERRFKFIFLTSTNLASNPRCLKEIELAYQLGFEVTVFAFKMGNWTHAAEDQIRKRLNGIEYHSLQATRTPFFPWLMNAIAAKGAKILYKLGCKSLLISAAVTDKRSITLLSAVRKKVPKCDLIIAHNPGAFYPAWQLSAKTGAPFAIDIEDFHPGENNGPLVDDTVTKVMKDILPNASYVSFASPLIREATLSLFKKGHLRKTLLINNVFPEREFPKPVSSDHDRCEKLKLVWFSQHISFNRGIDEILPLLEPFSTKLQLTLIGNLDLNFKVAVLDKYSFITVKGPMSQEQLNKSLGDHDIGLALESNKSGENRKICLTNKIWAYLQAGLCIWANNTPAQEQFARQFPHHTFIIDLDNKETVITLLQETLKNFSGLIRGKSTRWEINQQISWEIEKKTLIEQWDTVVQS